MQQCFTLNQPYDRTCFTPASIRIVLRGVDGVGISRHFIGGILAGVSRRPPGLSATQGLPVIVVMIDTLRY